MLTRRRFLIVAVTATAAGIVGANLKIGESMPNPIHLPPPIPPTVADYTFTDEFDGPAGTPPNPMNWSYFTGPVQNHESETYVTDPVNCCYDGDSHLAITVTSPSNGVYHSARISTQGKFSQQYGSWEASIAVEDTSGCWPACWFMGNNGSWPARGEADLMEDFGTGYTSGTIWSGITAAKIAARSTSAVDRNFHVYRMDWTVEGISMYRDGILFNSATPATLQPWTFDQSNGMYAILNVATGGTGTNGVNPDPSVLPVRMLVDYVHCWQ